MTKYIDADKLVIDLQHRCDALCPYTKAQRDVMCRACLLGDAIDTVEDQPAADVQEVVRCKDCRYREKEQPGMVYCPNIVGGWVGENWFCKAGEKE